MINLDLSGPRVQVLATMLGFLYAISTHLYFLDPPSLNLTKVELTEMF